MSLYRKTRGAETIPEHTIVAYRPQQHQVDLKVGNPCGFKATFNPTYPHKRSNPYGWVSPWHYGLDQGPIVLMIENYRTGLLWQVMRDCSYIASGLQHAGFSGGWLCAGPQRHLAVDTAHKTHQDMLATGEKPPREDPQTYHLMPIPIPPTDRGSPKREHKSPEGPRYPVAGGSPSGLKFQRRVGDRSGG